MVMFVPCRKLHKEFNTLYFCNFAKISLLYGKLKLSLRSKVLGEKISAVLMWLFLTDQERPNFAVTCFILFCSEVLCSQGVGPQQEENALSIWCDLWHRSVG